MKLNIELDVELVDSFENFDTVARVYYPNEGNTIQIKKGLNAIELSEAIFHEIGHIIDWYLSNQSNNVDVREKNANVIGESLRFRKSF